MECEPSNDTPRNVQPQDLADLIPAAYEELRRVARQRVSHLQPGGTLSPTELVNEVLLRLLKQQGREYQGTDHLIRVAAQAMHNVLVDRARRRQAAKRGGPNAARVAFDDDLPVAAPSDEMLGFHEACEIVRSRSEDDFELVLLRIYAGMSTAQIAQRRGLSTRTVERQWRYVKTLLHAHLNANRGLAPAD
jgi:RNA polymerase sigma factor (TIGR02999 family)